MRAAVLYGQEDLRLEDLPDPTVGTGEVLVRVVAAPTCGTDLKVWLRGGHARMLKPPTLFGHEFAGLIEAVGEGAGDWQVGERVVANNSAPCFECFFCRRERFSLCENLLFNNGTFAEVVRVPAAIVRHNLLRVPGGLSLELAAMTEPLACVLHGVEALDARPGDRVVVMGDGAIGLMLAAVLSHRGAEVILSGGQPARLALGERLGVHRTFNYRQAGELSKGDSTPVAALRGLVDRRGADAVVEATGSPTAWEQAIALARPGATVLLFGGCPRGTSIQVDTENLHYNELTLKGVFHNTPRHVREALALIASRQIPFELLLSDTLPLDGLALALSRMRDRSAVKIVIRPQPGA